MTRYNLENLYYTKVKYRQLLNKEGSIKKTYHIVLDIQSSKMKFIPGDCLGIMPENDPEIVNLTLKYMNIDPTCKITVSDKNLSFTLEDYLTKQANITRIKPILLKLLMKNAPTDRLKKNLAALLEDPDKLNKYIESHELWDTLKEFSLSNHSPQEICSCLLPMLPRLYSISSAHCLYPSEVHLTVAYLQYETSGLKRHGVASHFLCKLADKEVKTFVHPTHKFFLPKDPTTPMIMIASGAGIAPFVSFIQDRYFHKAKGKNWLFFGECNRAYDFYYEEFWNKLEKEKFIEITGAFSRDQKEKIYVQHRLLEHKNKVWDWLKEGAAVYVCGSAKNMAKDVEKAFLFIFKKAGGMSEIQATDYLQLLIKEKRYLKDVY